MKSILRIRKKGKTRGRPSKMERILTSVLDYTIRKNIDVIDDVYRAALVWGVGVIKLKRAEQERPHD